MKKDARAGKLCSEKSNQKDREDRDIDAIRAKGRFDQRQS